MSSAKEKKRYHPETDLTCAVAKMMAIGGKITLRNRGKKQVF